MKALLFQSYANNGIMMQFNVFDAEGQVGDARHSRMDFPVAL